MNRFGRTFEVDKGSIRPARMWVMDAARSGSTLPDRRLTDMGLVTSELVTNAIEHGAGATISIAVDCTSTAVTVMVTSGRGQSLPAVAQADVTSLTGRGLHIAASLADFLTFDSGTEFTRVAARFDTTVARSS